MKKFLIGSVAVIVGALVLGLIYELRYRLMPNWSAKAVGQITFEENINLTAEINSYFEHYHESQSSREYLCGHHFWGRDQKYVYVDLVCGMFKKTIDGTIETVYGYQAPTRIELGSNSEILSFSQPVDGVDNWASFNWLFPVEIQEIGKKLRSKDSWNNIHLLAYERARVKPTHVEGD